MVKQLCPLCRVPLPNGTEKNIEEASRRYFVVSRLVETGRTSWSALPTSAQYVLDATVTEWRALAEKGNAQAQYNLGVIYMSGQGVAQNDAEAVRWF